MADVKISDLPTVTTVVPAVDVLPLVSDSGTVTTKATPDDLVNASLLATGTSGYVLSRDDTALVWIDPPYGPSGYSGTSGFSGYSGTSGFSGYSGTSGYSGYSGISGYSGYSGISGYSGYSGIDGASGYSGIDGASGYSGYSGYSGFNGTTTLQTVLLADLQDKTSAVNTVGKVEGLILFESVTPQIVVASGSADIDPWQVFAAGVTPITPA